MIELRCTAGHRSTRISLAAHLDDPRCYELTPAADGFRSFCLAPAWQDPASVRKGDIAVLLEKGKAVPAMVESWSGDPDHHASLIGRDGTVRRLYLDSWWTPGQPCRHTAGQPLIALADAEAQRLELKRAARAAARDRRDEVRRAREAEMAAVLAAPPEPRRERPSDLELGAIPWNLYDAARDAHESAALQSHREAHRRLKTAMAQLRAHHSPYYDVLVENLYHGCGPAEIQRNLQICSYEAAKMRLSRARRRLVEFLQEEQLPVTIAPQQSSVDSPSESGIAS